MFGGTQEIRRRARRAGVLTVVALVAGAGNASAASTDVRVRFTGAMEGFAQPNLMPALSTIVEIRKSAWDFVWTGKVDQLLGGSIGYPQVLLASGRQLTTYTDRPTCAVPLALNPSSSPPFVVVEARQPNTVLMSILTPWASAYIDSVPARACTTQFSPAYAGGTLASNATWSPQRPSISTASVESEGTQHLSNAIFRVTASTPATDVPYSFSYSYTNADGSINKIIWVGRVTIETDPQGKVTPIDLSDQLPGSAGQGLPGEPQPNDRVTGEFLLGILDEATAPVVRDLTGRRGSAARLAASPTIPLPPPESWAEPGTVRVSVCTAKRKPSKFGACTRAAASGQVKVNGVTTRTAGAPQAAADPPLNPSLKLKSTASGRTALHAKSTKYVLVGITFTGATSGVRVSTTRSIKLR